MQDIFGFSLLICFVLLIIGIIVPARALFWYNGNRNRKNVFKFYGIGIFVLFICFGISSDIEKTETSAIVENKSTLPYKENSRSNINGKSVYDANGKKLTEYTIESIQYKVLRSWNPNNDNLAIGMDILIDKKNISEEAIKRLIAEIVGSQVELANILIFSSRNAWVEGQRGSGFTDDYKKNYIAFYVKNSTQKGAYTGFNEIRWMQEVGKLASKYGSKTKI